MRIFNSFYFVISAYYRLKRLKWAGQVIRVEPNEISKEAMIMQPKSRRKEGRPRMRLVDKISCVAKTCRLL